MKALIVVLVLALATAGTALAKGGSGGVSDGPAFSVDGQLYRTVATPTDLSKTGAPAHSFDTINGGRWMVHALAFNTSWAATVAAHDANDSGNLDSDAEIAAALADAGPAGARDLGVVKMFVCPVIKL